MSTSSVIPVVVVLGAAIASVRVAVAERDQPSTQQALKDRARHPRLGHLEPVATSVHAPRGRVASGFALVGLVAALGILVALGIGALVVAATVALRETVS